MNFSSREPSSRELATPYSSLMSPSLSRKFAANPSTCALFSDTVTCVAPSSLAPMSNSINYSATGSTWLILPHPKSSSYDMKVPDDRPCKVTTRAIRRRQGRPWMTWRAPPHTSDNTATKVLIGGSLMAKLCASISAPPLIRCRSYLFLSFF